MKSKVANDNESRRIMSLREGLEWSLKIRIGSAVPAPNLDRLTAQGTAPSAVWNAAEGHPEGTGFTKGNHAPR